MALGEKYICCSALCTLFLNLMSPQHNLKSVLPKMIEPLMRSPHFEIIYQKRQLKAFNRAFQNEPVNNSHSPAFQSLSFRGNKGYTNNIITRPRSEHQESPRKNKTYGAIIRIKTANKYALVQGSYTGKWSFPKGHSNEGELPIECTLREVAEETGIDELPEPLKYIQIGYGNYFIFNLDEQVPLIPRDTHEIMNTKWVTLDEMERMPLNADASLYRKQLAAEREYVN